jgi:hypothetical protein
MHMPGGMSSGQPARRKTSARNRRRRTEQALPFAQTHHLQVTFGIRTCQLDTIKPHGLIGRNRWKSPRRPHGCLQGFGSVACSSGQKGQGGQQALADFLALAFARSPVASQGRIRAGRSDPVDLVADGGVGVEAGADGRALVLLSGRSA